jgi:hypothetical protein
MRIDAQGKYVQTIMDKACQTLAGENVNCHGYNKLIAYQGFGDMGNMRDFGSVVNLPSLEDLHVNEDNSHSGFQLQETRVAASHLHLEEDALKDGQLQMSLTTDGSSPMNFMPRS